MHPLVKISRKLAKEVSKLEFPETITHIYNPLEYARAPHETYLEQYGNPPVEVLMVGMNPGPWGMAQTGVPFGDVAMVRDWMGIQARVKRPKNEHPKRPISGFDCERSEVSGSRLWGWAQKRFGKADRFFKRFFVVNFCPLVFMEESARNFTPDKLPVEYRKPLSAVCNAALAQTVEALKPKYVVGVGAYAEKQIQQALGDRPIAQKVQVGRVLHPSPASPIANRGWAPQAEGDFKKIGIPLPR